MRTASLILSISLSVALGCSKNDRGEREGEATTSTDASATAAASTVEDDYAALTKALREGDGKGASSLVTASTLEKYDSCRKLALDSAGVDFADLDPFTVFFIYQLRYLLEAAKLREMSGKDLFEWGVDSGLVNKDSLAAIGLNKVQYDGPVAYATLTQGGRAVQDGVFTFRKESGRWKLDMIEVLRMANAQLEKIRKDAGKSKVDFAIFMLERTYGAGNIPEAILNGPLK